MENAQRQEIIRQIGKMNILAISGGRVTAIEDGIELPISNGYKVRVILTPSDTYRVERVFVRAGKVTPKGHCDDVYCDEIGEVAYYASCYRNDNGQWTYGNPSAKQVAS